MRRISSAPALLMASQPLDPITKIRNAFDAAIRIEIGPFGESMKNEIEAKEIIKNHADDLTHEQIQKAFDKAIQKKNSTQVINDELLMFIIRDKPQLLSNRQICLAFEISTEIFPDNKMLNSDLASELLCYLYSSERSDLLEDKIQPTVDRALEAMKKIGPQPLHNDYEFTRSNAMDFDLLSTFHGAHEETTEYNPPIEALIGTIVNYFGDVLSDASLIELFTLTSDTDLLRDIQRYVAINREDLELPCRNDIEIRTTRHFFGVAFDIHTFAKNLDKRCISYIKTMIAKNQLLLIPFAIEDLIGQIRSCFIEDDSNRDLALFALQKIERSAEYKKKLENILSLIATFIIHGKQLGLSGETSEDNWTLWINQSLVESATAYNGDETTSCVPGIYERLFTGFQTMHPVLDLLFLPASLVKFYFPIEKWERDPKLEILKNQNVLEHILKQLSPFSVKWNRHELNEVIKSCILNQLQDEFTQGKNEKLLHARVFLPERYKIHDIIARIWNGKLKTIEPKLDAFLNSLDNLDLYQGLKPAEPLIFTHWIAQMISTLDIMFQASKMTDLEKLAAITNIVTANLEKIKNPQLFHRKLFDLDHEEKSERIDIEFETLTALRELLGDSLKDEDGLWRNPFPTFLNEPEIKEFSKNPEFNFSPQE